MDTADPQTGREKATLCAPAFPPIEVTTLIKMRNARKSTTRAVLLKLIQKTDHVNVTMGCLWYYKMAASAIRWAGVMPPYVVVNRGLLNARRAEPHASTSAESFFLHLDKSRRTSAPKQCGEGEHH